MNKYAEVYTRLDELLSYDDFIWDMIEKFNESLNDDISTIDIRKVINFLMWTEKESKKE
jgi:hypothetical protein